MSTVPSWITVGTPVVVVTNRPTGIPREVYTLTTIKKVNQKTFSIDGDDRRFPLDTQRLTGAHIAASSSVVLSAESEEGLRARRRRQRQMLITQADRRIDAYQNDRGDIEKIDAAIEVLQKLRKNVVEYGIKI